jgi:signal transduction histidine kinase
MVLLGVVYLFVRHTLTPQSIIDGIPEPARPEITGPPTTPPEPDIPNHQLPDVAVSARDAALSTVLRSSAVAVVLLATLSIAVGWWVAGRVLRRLHRITATARELSWRDLRQRLNMGGPDDELKELADTFDAMLSRLDQAFDAQRRFAGNAAHELRTPLAIERAAIQIGLHDPTPEQLREVRQQLLETNQRAERLLDGLVLLAQSDNGLATREPVDLATIIAATVESFQEVAVANEVTVQVDARSTVVAGDAGLLEQLVGNIVQNAVRYNHPGGQVQVRTITPAGLEVSNTGPVVPADTVDRLFEPFHRGGPDRVGSANGAGLGLSIVRTIATAHAGEVSAVPNPAGGLTVRVTLPGS